MFCSLDEYETESRASSPPNTKNPSLLAWLLAALTIITMYNIYTFNRFLPLTEGWFSTYAQLILEGKVPYRDFYLLLPPLYPLTIAGLMAVFGKQLLMLRVFGIGLIILMTSTLYAVLARFFQHVVAAIATVVAIIYYQSGVAHISYDFIQFVTTYALLSVYCFLKYYDACPSTNHTIRHWTKKDGYLLLSGVFGALAFWIKQSNGAVIFIFIALGIVLTTLPIRKQWMYKSILGFGLGAALPTLLLLSWLYQHDAFYTFWQQIVTDAIQSKGSLSQIFFSWIKGLCCKQYVDQLTHIVLFLIYLGYWRFLIGNHHRIIHNDWKKDWPYLGVFALLGLALLLPFWSPMIVQKTQNTSQIVVNNAIVLSSAITFLLILKYCFSPKRQSPEIMLSMLALGYIVGCGTSAGITETGAFMGFALFLCHVFSAKSFFQLGRVVFLGLSLCLITFYAQRKYTEPYAWWYIKTPEISSATHRTHLPLLEGFYLPAATLTLLETVDRIVQETTSEQDAILTFPNIPLFYLIENRLCNIKAVVHWPDFLPDNLAHLEAKRIKAEPPKVIIYLALPEIVWSTHERLFRGGQRSGQREIIATIADLTEHNKHYHLKASIPVCDGVNLYVWAYQKVTSNSIPQTAG